MAINLTERISIGRPITREGVSLFPVYVHDAAPDRLGRGGGTAVTVAEQEDAEVPTLVATNDGDAPVLLVEGETVVGGQQDRNFRVTPADGRAVVLKVANRLWGVPALEAQNAALLHLRAAGFPAPEPLPALDGSLLVETQVGDEVLPVRLLTYVERSEEHTSELQSH